MNLDAQCAEYGHAIIQQVLASLGKSPSEPVEKDVRSDIENTITKSLGVLQENGVYAFFLFLASRMRNREDRDGKKDAEKVTAYQVDTQMKRLLREDKLKLLGTEQDDFEAIKRMTNDLDQLLLARQLIERSLVYARYHAKALKPPEGEPQRQEAATS